MTRMEARPGTLAPLAQLTQNKCANTSNLFPPNSQQADQADRHGPKAACGK